MNKKSILKHKNSFLIVLEQCAHPINVTMDLKKRIILLFFSLLICPSLHSQMIMKGKISQAKAGEKILINVPFDNWFHKENSIETSLSETGEFTFSLNVTKPQTIFLDFADQRFHLYAEPGKTLFFEADMRDFSETMEFKGELAAENTFRKEIGLTFYKIYPQNWNDSLSTPHEIMEGIEIGQKLALEKLRNIKSANKEFFRMTQADIQYFGSSKVMALIFKNNVWTSNRPSRFSRDDWRQTLETAYASQPLSNEAAVDSYHYQQTVTYYHYYLEWVAPSTEAFQKTVEEIFNMPFEKAVEEIRNKGSRYWVYVAINHGLQDLALEQAVVSFIVNGLYLGELEYLEEAYEDFSKRFPQSSHRPEVDKMMQPFLSSKLNNSNPGIFLDSLSEQYKNIEEILVSHKGRLVYVDLWGSWCGPCREQFAYADALKKRFEDAPVDFVYIAFEHSKDPLRTWKEAVLFYQLQGRHILAGKDLESHFRELYDEEGTLYFPSYLLFDNSGKMITKLADRPDAGEALYALIEKYL